MGSIVQKNRQPTGRAGLQMLPTSGAVNGRDADFRGNPAQLLASSRLRRIAPSGEGPAARWN